MYWLLWARKIERGWKVSWVLVWPRFLQKQSKMSFLITIQEEEFIFGPLSSLVNLCRAGPWTAIGKLVNKQMLLTFYRPWCPLPLSIAFLSTAFRGYRSFQPGLPFNHPTFRGGLKVKAFMCKVQSGTCIIITLHFAQQILNQHQLCAKNTVLGLWAVFFKL